MCSFCKHVTPLTGKGSLPSCQHASNLSWYGGVSVAAEIIELQFEWWGCSCENPKAKLIPSHNDWGWLSRANTPTCSLSVCGINGCLVHDQSPTLACLFWGCFTHKCCFFPENVDASYIGTIHLHVSVCAYRVCVYACIHGMHACTMHDLNNIRLCCSILLKT